MKKLLAKWYLIKYSDRARRPFLRKGFLVLAAAAVLITGAVFGIKTISGKRNNPSGNNTQTNSYIHTVAIDASRGGESDTGYAVGSSFEKDINLDIALRTAAILEAKGYKVILVRNNDSYISPQDRLDIITKEKSELLVSISLGYSEEDSEISGIKTFIRAASATQSLGFADAIRTSVAKACGQADLGNEVSSSYILLRDTKIPAVVLQAGYASNFRDERKLLAAEYRQSVAAAIADAVVSSFLGK